MKCKGVLLWLCIVVAAGAVSFSLGWVMRGASAAKPILPLRLSDSGYHYIDPLLACNSAKSFPQASDVSGAIQSVISQHESAGDITSASTYFADFSTGRWSNVNGSAKYYPSSLGKVPILMAYYALAENSSTMLDESVLYPLASQNLNAQQEIQPEKAIVPGQTYTVRELLAYMIQYSDNNAAQLLYVSANPEALNSIYADLQVPVDDEVTSSTLDFMTPQQYSILFRTLYNATYLSRSDSEAALQLMTQTSFTEGLVAGVPSSTPIAHKFGIVSFYNGLVVTNRELHDCGIVYAPGHPYLLCVMTRGASDLGSMEQTISDISRAVYQKVEGGE